MAREIYCARCGKQLAMSIKAVPQLATTMALVEPHECGEMEQLDFTSVTEISSTLSRREQDKTISRFPFSQHIDESTKRVAKPSFAQIDGDRRPTEAQRSEIDSTAPEGLRNMALGRSEGTVKEGDLEYDLANSDEGEEMGG